MTKKETGAPAGAPIPNETTRKDKLKSLVLKVTLWIYLLIVIYLLIWK